MLIRAKYIHVNLSSCHWPLHCLTEKQEDCVLEWPPPHVSRDTVGEVMKIFGPLSVSYYIRGGSNGLCFEKRSISITWQ